MVDEAAQKDQEAYEEDYQKLVRRISHVLYSVPFMTELPIDLFLRPADRDRCGTLPQVS